MGSMGSRQGETKVMIPSRKRMKYCMRQAPFQYRASGPVVCPGNIRRAKIQYIIYTRFVIEFL